MSASLRSPSPLEEEGRGGGYAARMSASAPASQSPKGSLGVRPCGFDSIIKFFETGSDPQGLTPIRRSAFPLEGGKGRVVHQTVISMSYFLLPTPYSLEERSE